MTDTRTATDDNSQMILYHGTRAAFRGSGGMVLPGSQVGRDNWSQPDDSNDYVYVTPDVKVAEHFARKAAGRLSPRVLTVMPCGSVEVDLYGEMSGFDAYRCEAARVISVRILKEVTT